MGKLIPSLQTSLLLIFISLLILSLDFFHLLNPIRSLGYKLTNPLSFGIYKTRQSVNRQFYFIFAARFAAKENKVLQDQIGQLVSENANLRHDLAQAQALLEQEKSLDPKTYHLISARPIGLDRYLKIDKGSDDGVKVDMPAVFKDNYLGQVINVSPSSASIRLLNDPDSKLAVFSLGKEGRSKGVLKGQFGLEMNIDKILHEEKISIGDLVYSEGTEGFLPRGLIAGRVTDVLDKENDVFKQAKVKPVFDIRDLELVFLIQD